MDSVYLLYENDGVSYNVIGVYTSEALAEAKQNELDVRDGLIGGLASHRYVDEIELNSDILV